MKPISALFKGNGHIKQAITRGISLLLAVVMLTLLIPLQAVAAAVPTVTGNDTINIGIASDIHISHSDSAGSKTMERLLRSCIQGFYSASGNSLDAVAFNGDLTDNGYVDELKTFRAIVGEELSGDTQLTASMGNHEFYKYGWGVDVGANAGMKEEMQADFTREIGVGIEDDISVKGVHVLSVSPDNELDSYQNRESFLRAHIEAAAQEDPTNPIILVAHKPVKYTVLSSGTVPNGSYATLAADWSESFLEFLKQYPQIIYFSGHAHDDLGKEDMIYQQDFTSVQDGVVSVDSASTSLLVSIDSNKVVTINRINNTDGTFFTPSWTIDIPSVVESKENFQYRDSNAVSNISLTMGENASELYVNWYNTSFQTAKVQYATADHFVDGILSDPIEVTAYGRGTAYGSDNYYNHAFLENLEPGTSYCYRVGNENGWSDYAVFTTPESSADINFIFAADAQIGSSNTASDTAGWVDTMSKAAAKFPEAQFMIHVGDQVEVSSDTDQYSGFLAPSELVGLPLATVAGNHDFNSLLYSQHFAFDNTDGNTVSKAAGTYSGDYWYVRNQTLFLALNSNVQNTQAHQNFMQQAILDAQAAGYTIKWKVAIFHHSIFSTAGHSTNEDIIRRRETLPQVFSDLQIDLVLMGHDHIYCRTYLMNGRTPATENGGGGTLTDPAPGEVLYITGESASGSKYYDLIGENYDFSAVTYQNYSPGISNVGISDNTLTVHTYDTSNMDAPTDSVTIKRTQAPAGDTLKPYLFLPTENDVVLGESFDMLSGVSAVDNTDGDITGSIVATGNVDTATEGTYVLTYEVIDSAGNTASGRRSISVKKEISSTEGLYFGFDIKSGQLQNESTGAVSYSTYNKTGDYTFKYDDTIHQTVLTGPETGNLVIDGLNLAPLDNAFTVETYIKIPSTVTSYDIFQFDGQNINLVGFPGNTYFGSGRHSGGDADVSVEKNLPTDQWVHILCTGKEGKQTLYVNGEVFASNSYAGLNLTSTNDDELILGGTYSGRSGAIQFAYFRIYSVFVNDTQAQSLYSSKQSGLSADYTAVDAAIAKIPADLSIYTDDSVQSLNAAKAAVDRSKTVADQAVVDNYAQAIEAALTALSFKGDADYTGVSAALARVPSDLSNYTAESAAALSTAVSAVVPGKSRSEQAEVDGYADAINAAVDALVLKDADYTAVDAAIAGVPENLGMYSAATVQSLNAALNAVIRSLKITEQSVVDGYAEAINAAVSALTVAIKNINLTVGANKSELFINWFGASATEGTVQYSLQSDLVDGVLSTYDSVDAYSSGQAAGSAYYYNHVRLTNLQPGTAYAYRVGTLENWSDYYTVTAPAESDTLSILFAPDPQIGIKDISAEAAGWRSTLQNALTLFPETQMMFLGGDQINKASNNDQYDGLFTPTQLTSLPLATVVGNHDLNSELYSQHFAYANVDSNTGKAATGEYGGDYWFVRNNTLFMVLNSNIINDIEPDTQAHKAFMQQAISDAGPGIKWKVLVFHHAIFSTGEHSNDATSIKRQQALAPVISDLQIDLVLNGHDHVYCRTYLMDGLTPIITGNSVINPDPGQVLYLTGNSSSGSKFYEVVQGNAEYAAVTNTDIVTITKLSISDTTLSVTAYNSADMSELDRFTIEKTVTEDTLKPFLYLPEKNDVLRDAAFDPLAGVSAYDNVDGDLTSQITVSGEVDTAREGSYTLTYQVADSAGNTATADRIVTVGKVLYYGMDIKAGLFRNETGSQVSSVYNNPGGYTFETDLLLKQNVLVGPSNGNLGIGGLNLAPLNNQFSVEAYIYIPSSLTAYDVFQFDEQNINLVGVPGATYFGAGKYDGAGDADVYAAKSLPAGQWVHVLCTAMEGKQVLYVNGVEFASDTYTALNASYSSADEMILGGTLSGRSGEIKFAALRIYSNYITAEAAKDAYETMQNSFLANYSAVDAALAKVPADLSVYTEETAAALSEAVAAVVRGKTADEQDVVDGYAAAIEAAINGLELKDNTQAADYSAVDAALAKVPADLSVYTEETATALSEAVAAVVRSKTADEQDVVDGYAAAIEAAIDGLQRLVTIDISQIAGVEKPVKGAVPAATVTETTEYTGTIDWSPKAQTFEGNTIYIATIVLTPKAGFTLKGVAENFFIVAGAVTASPADSGVVTAAFPATETENSGGGNGGGTVSTTPQINVSTEEGITTATMAVAATGSDSAKTAKISGTQAASAIKKAAEQAEKNGTQAVVALKVSGTASAQAVTTTIPQVSMASLTENDISRLAIVTAIATVTFDDAAISAINAKADVDISVTMKEVNLSALSQAQQALAEGRMVYEFTVSAGDAAISYFGGGTATVALPYTPAEGEDPNTIVVYYLSDSGTMQVVPGRYDATTGLVTFTTTHFSKYVVGSNKISFSDVSASDWYADAVSFIAARQITIGTTADTFTPNGTLTRGQFIVMLMRAYGIELGTDTADNFSDAGDVYYTAYLAKARQLGITNGVGDNRFAPDQAITRQDMFTLLYRALDTLGSLPKGSESVTISDYADSAAVSDYAEEAVSCFLKAGVITGAAGHLNPEDTTTRAEMAQVLYKLLSV